MISDNSSLSSTLNLTNTTRPCTLPSKPSLLFHTHSSWGNMPGTDVFWFVPDICRMKGKDTAETLSYTFCLDPLIHKHCWLGASGEILFLCFQAEKKTVCVSPTVTGLFWLKLSFFLPWLAMRGCTNSCFQPTFYFDNSLSAKSEAIPNCNFDIFVAMNGVMESMWCGLQRSSWTISSSETKGLWSKLIVTKTKQRSLFVHVDIVHILGHICPSVS